MLIKNNNVLIAGYFDRANLGDDLFRDVWKFIFSNNKALSHYKVHYESLDDLKVYQNLSNIDVIILAGGDILNSYFLDELHKFLKSNNFNGRLYAVSVGIPYSDVIVDGSLDIFNFIMCRAKVDACAVRRRFGEEHVRYFPDLSVYLPRLFCTSKP